MLEIPVLKHDAKSEFLDRWVGEWEDTGNSQRIKAIRDRMTVEWTVNRRFLRFTYRALEGDNYEGEGYRNDGGFSQGRPI